MPNGDWFGAEPNALVEPKALLPEVDPKGELATGAGVVPKGLGAGAEEPNAPEEPNAGFVSFALEVPNVGLDPLVPEEPNAGFAPPTAGREEATPPPNPKVVVGAGADDAGVDDAAG